MFFPKRLVSRWKLLKLMKRAMINRDRSKHRVTEQYTLQQQTQHEQPCCNIPPRREKWFLYGHSNNQWCIGNSYTYL